MGLYCNSISLIHCAKWDLYIDVRWLAQRQPKDFFLNIRRFKYLIGGCSGFLEMFPTLIVDRDHALWLECMENLYGLSGIERKTHGSQNGEPCRTDVQYSCPDPEALADLTQSVE